MRGALTTRPTSSASRFSLCFACKDRSRQLVEPGVLLELFPRCIDSVVTATSPSDAFEVVVADFESSDWPLAEWLPSRLGERQHRIVPVSGPFSRGRGLNAAAAQATGDTLFFLDVDMLVPRAVLDLGRDAVAQRRAQVLNGVRDRREV